MRTSSYPAIMVGLLAIGVLAAGCGASPAGASVPQALQVVTLCRPRGTSAAELTVARQIVASRLRTYHLQATVGLRRESGCVLVHLRRHVAGIHTLASMLAEQGVFVQGIGVPPSSIGPEWGERVRYTTDPVTRANQILPLVRPIFGSGDIHRSSVRIFSRWLIRFDLKPAARRAWCRFNASHGGKISPALFDRVVMDPLTLNPGGCMTFVSVLPFPFSNMRLCTALLADGHYSPLRIPALWSSAVPVGPGQHQLVSGTRVQCSSRRLLVMAA